MAKPQQPELRRSGRVPALDPDASEAVLSATDPIQRPGAEGPIPEDQRPGHHPDHDQDKPDLDAFAERLGIVSDEGNARGRKGSDRPDDRPVASLSERRAERAGAGRPESLDPLSRAIRLALTPPVVTCVLFRGVARGLRSVATR